MINQIELEIINRGLGIDFIDKITTLESLVNETNWTNKSFIVQPNRDEVIFENFSLNEEWHFVGRSFKKNNITVWCGYRVPYEYCIDFWSEDDSKKNQVHQNLLQKNINVHELYSPVEYRNKITRNIKKEEYWFSILIKDLIKLNLLSHGNELYSSVVNFIDSLL